jgi:VIT1/CCC1 family predicted Fe2+/Mn2+ transporter
MFILILGLINVIPARLSGESYVQDYIALAMFGFAVMFLLYSLKKASE